MDKWIIKKEEDNFVEEEIEILRKELSSKYGKPRYTGKDIHIYVRDYLKNQKNEVYLKSIEDDDKLQTEKIEEEFK